MGYGVVGDERRSIGSFVGETMSAREGDSVGPGRNGIGWGVGAWDAGDCDAVGEGPCTIRRFGVGSGPAEVVRDWSSLADDEVSVCFRFLGGGGRGGGHGASGIWI